MSRIFQRILVLSAAAIMAMPGAVWAQQSQDTASGQDTPQAGQSAPEGQAQGRQHGPWTRQRQQMEMLARKLNLTDGQRQQFHEISQRSRQQGITIRNDSSLTDDQKKEKLQA